MGHKTFPRFQTAGNTLVRYHSSLWKAEVPQGIEVIGDSAFRDNEYLETVVLPQGVTHIGAGAFSGCYRLTEVHLPDTLISIGEEAFSDCTELCALVIPDSVCEIGPAAFYNCNRLTQLEIPPNVRVLSRSVFAECSDLAQISLPEGITGIEDKAFYCCESLTSLYIPPDATLPDPIDELFFRSGLEILWTPGRSLSALGPWKTQAALGYMDLTAKGCPFPRELAEEYEAYIHSNPTDFYFTSVLQDLPLRHMMEHGHIPRKDAVLLLEMFELEDRFSLKASILDYLGAVSPEENPLSRYTL